MPQKITFKLLLILGIFLLFGYFLIPTIQFNTMSQEEKAALEREDNRKYKELLKKSIKLGLDLQGGMHLILEVDVREFLDKLAQNKDDRFNKSLTAAAIASTESGTDIVDALDENLQEAGADITRYYATRELYTRDEVLAFLKEETKKSIDRSLEVLRNRVDEFGVSEPIIQKQGNNRIIVELAGVTDRQQAINLVGKTAKLEFSLLKDLDNVQRIASKINDYLIGKAADTDSSDIASADSTSAPEDTSLVSAEELFGSVDDTSTADSTGLASNEVDENAQLFYLAPQGLAIKQSQTRRFQELMDNPEIQKIIQRETTNAKFLLQKTSDVNFDNQDGDTYLDVYLVNSSPALTGETIIDAEDRPSSLDDPSNLGKFEVNMTFNSEGTRAFAAVTGANEGKQMAIVLDNKVYLAPRIQEKIRQGRARITGLDSNDEAKMVSSVLKAGALPTPLQIIEERTVGPSLGQDSIDKGTFSTLAGLFLVAIFMIVYYKFSGFVANIALIMNIFILLGFMSSLHATLTLPGIAGIILTIGMAVDANVLIFERIREELDKGKSVWQALDTGYGRAFITILDANVTTFIAAVVLYNFGTGPIRGFATTLMIGIGASMFTAIFVTRTLFELMLSKKIMKQMSI